MTRRSGSDGKPGKTPKPYRHILRPNAASLIGYEIFIKLIMVVSLIPMTYYLFNFTMYLSGFRYLTAENVGRFLRHPQIYFFGAAVFLLLQILCVFDVSGVIFITDRSYHNEKTDMLAALRFAAENTRNILEPGRLRTGLTALLAGVLFSLGMIPSAVNRVALSDFISRWIEGNPAVIAGIAALVLLLAVLFLNRMYVFHYVTLEGCTYKEARLRSRNLSRGRRGKDFLMMLALEAVFYLIYAAAIAVGLLIALGISRLFAWSTGLHFLSETAALVILAATMIVFTALGTPVGYLCVAVRYYRHKEEAGERAKSLPVQKSEKKREKQGTMKIGRFRVGKRTAAGGLLILVALVLLPYYISWTQRGYSLNVEFLHRMQVTAHRGASRYYPENTMAAFEGAAEQGANWIELDVHESSDRKIFVMHDSSFRRTAGTNRSAWELTYDEISKLDAGSFFGSAYAGEQIPLLSDVIRFAKQAKIPLNIEIKPSGHEEFLENDLVNLLEEENFTGQCVVTSQSYASISKVKDLNPDIKTIYVMGFAYGNISRLKKADGFSVRYTSVTGDLVSRVHNAGKEIYAWTVNSRWAIDDMIDRQVDNIITDNVPLAKSRIEKNESGDVLAGYLRLLNDLI
jgi:glycerophosphoryl diester phosphodiesterase